MNDRLVWIDCEMTGLDLDHDALIEIAAKSCPAMPSG